MEADYIYNYSDAQDIRHQSLRFVQKSTIPGFAIFQPYGSPNFVQLHLAGIGLNAAGMKLANIAVTCDPWRDVIDFHKRFGRDYDGPPRRLEASLEAFRINFMEEEHLEMLEADNDNEKLDAIVDYVYVALGYCRLRGWNFSEAWRRVQEKNMQKVPATQADVDSKRARHIDDILKPPGWTPPDHSDLVAIKEVVK